MAKTVKIVFTLLSGIELPVTVHDGDIKEVRDKLMICIDRSRAFVAELSGGTTLIVNCANVVTAQVEPSPVGDLS